ncbi:hypothetical protein [Streptomyces sp. DSM 40907]|uniref:hypothetical protein n=1 Tax=Streptomyces kutzneri TaxID=3051179 RepID=UPI0028D0D751|nr:hypothetical protein [Streptomyces sp. DSM 40907]
MPLTFSVRRRGQATSEVPLSSFSTGSCGPVASCANAYVTNPLSFGAGALSPSSLTISSVRGPGANWSLSGSSGVVKLM